MLSRDDFSEKGKIFWVFDIEVNTPVEKKFVNKRHQIEVINFSLQYDYITFFIYRIINSCT